MSELKIESSAIDASGCISEGWNLVKSDYGLFILMCLFPIILSIPLNFVPYVGKIINALISAPLLCGIYIALLAKRRGEVVSFRMIFEGFRSFIPVFLVKLITTVPALIYAGAIYLLIALPAQTGNTAAIGSLPGILRGGFSPVLIVSALALYLIIFILQIMLFFAIPLIADHKLGFVEAVKLSVNAAVNNLGGLILLFILEILLALGGVIALCIGIIFVIPIIHAANIIAYKSVFPDTEDSLFNEPPQPDYYNGMFGANN